MAVNVLLRVCACVYVCKCVCVYVYCIRRVEGMFMIVSVLLGGRAFVCLFACVCACMCDVFGVLSVW